MIRDGEFSSCFQDELLVRMPSLHSRCVRARATHPCRSKCPARINSVSPGNSVRRRDYPLGTEGETGTRFRTHSGPSASRQAVGLEFNLRQPIRELHSQPHLGLFPTFISACFPSFTLFITEILKHI